MSFAGCYNLQKVEIPNTVVDIGKYAFFECKKINNIIIPSEVTKIENGTFCWCSSLNEIMIPSKVTYIGEEAFFKCPISKIEIPNKVSYIGRGAFGCCNLGNVIIPDSVEYMGGDLFDDNENLEYIVLPNSVNIIDEMNEGMFDRVGKDFKMYLIKNSETEKYAIEKNYKYEYLQLQNIDIVVQPDKIIYYVGEKFDSAGMKVVGYYKYDISKTVEYKIDSKDYSIKPDSVLEYGTSNVTISYENNDIIKTINQSIEVKDTVKTFNLTIDPAGGQMILPKTGNSETQTTTEAYNNLEFTYGTQRLFMKTAYIATTADKDKAWLGTYSGKAINGDNLMIKDGCKFKQWKIISGEGQIIDEPVEGDENGTIHNYYFDGKCEGDVVIRAEWETLPTITVDPNGANMKLVKDEIITQPQSVTFYYGNKEKRVFAKVGKISGAENSQDKWFCFTRMNDLNIPYREGYTFDGWKITEGTGEITEEQDEDGRYSYYYDCSYNGNVTIQAQWKKVDNEVPEPIKIEIKENPKTIKSISKISETQYLIVDKNTKAEDILKDLIINSEDFELEIKGATSNEEKAKTGHEIAIKDSEETTNMVIIVKGDVDSDGEVSFRDVLKLNNYRLNKEQNNANWNSAEKIAYKSITETEIANEEIGEMSFRNIITLNNFRLRN